MNKQMISFSGVLFVLWTNETVTVLPVADVTTFVFPFEGLESEGTAGYARMHIADLLEVLTGSQLSSKNSTR